jgi:hypothetical protein
MLAVRGGLILVGMVDDSPLVAAMATGGVPVVCSALCRACAVGRGEILRKLLFLFGSLFALIGWIAAMLICTQGTPSD